MYYVVPYYGGWRQAGSSSSGYSTAATMTLSNASRCPMSYSGTEYPTANFEYVGILAYKTTSTAYYQGGYNSSYNYGRNYINTVFDGSVYWSCGSNTYTADQVYENLISVEDHSVIENLTGNYLGEIPSIEISGRWKKRSDTYSTSMSSAASDCKATCPGGTTFTPSTYGYIFTIRFSYNDVDGYKAIWGAPSQNKVVFATSYVERSTGNSTYSLHTTSSTYTESTWGENFLSINNAVGQTIEGDGIFDFGETPQTVPETFYLWLNANYFQIGDGQFTFYDADGNIIANFEDALNITGMDMQTVGRTHYLTITFSDGSTQDIEWRSQDKEGYDFAGLGLAAGTSTVIIEANGSIECDFSGTVNFYEIFIKSGYKPSVEFSIAFMTNTAENNRVDKGGYLTTKFTQLGALRESTNMFTPEILFEYDGDGTPEFNYVYIDIFKRYYYLQSLVAVRTGLWRMSLKCDVLMSFKDEIESQYAYIGRSEYNYNEMLVDSEYPLYANKEIERLEWSADASLVSSVLPVTQWPTDPTGENYWMYVVTLLQSD